MKRRTKHDMMEMRLDVKEYLYRCDNNPHKAWDLYITENIHKLRPHYIRGIKDFINVSKEIEEEQKQEQERAQRKLETQIEKQDIEKQILSMTAAEAFTLWKKYKSVLNDSNRIALCDICNTLSWIEQGNAGKVTIDHTHINVFKTIQHLELNQTA